MICKVKECFIESVKDIEIAWPSDDAVRLANAIFHTYKLDQYKELELEVPLSRICAMFKLEYNAQSLSVISKLINEILDEPVAVINKELNHKHIEWATYDFFTLLQPLEMGGDAIKLRINPEYLTITQEFVVNPFLEF